jgi:hypothetical protein
MKKSIVIACEYDKPYKFPNGDVIHYHRLVLQNGDKGNCGVSEMFSNKIAVGQEINYQIENNRIKIISEAPTQKEYTPPQQQTKNKFMPNTNEDKPIQRKYTKAPEDAITFIMGYASNRHVAKITATKKDVPLQEMLDEADLIYEHYKKMLNS